LLIWSLICISKAGELSLTESNNVAVLEEAPADSYTWSFPGSPVRVQLHLDVVERLRPSIRSATGHTQQEELRGLLIGHFEAQRQTVEVTDFQFVTQTSDLDKLLASTSAVGFFRSHLREGLSLDEKDLSLFQKHFPKPSHVFLLIKPMEDDAATGGFFFWDNGAIHSGFSFLEFPFHPELLKLEATQTVHQPFEPVVEPEIAPQPKPEPRKRLGVRFSFPALTLMSILLIAIGVAIAFTLMQTNAWLSLQPKHSTALQLQVRQQDEGFWVTWNRDTPILLSGQATGVLTIHDGTQKRELTLAAAELRMGSVVYSTTSSNVRFDLEVAVRESTTALKAASQ